MTGKSVIEQVRLEVNDLRLSKWISRVELNESVYYVIWVQLVFSNKVN